MPPGDTRAPVYMRMGLIFPGRQSAPKIYPVDSLSASLRVASLSASLTPVPRVASLTASLTLWQTTIIPRNEVIYNASVRQGTDAWVPFTIGVAAQFKPDELKPGIHSQSVLCAISDNTDRRRRPTGPQNRTTYLNTLAQNGILNQSLSPTDYFRTLSDYKFVISPEGNGIDCHRHYEALIAGCIPIVENHPGIAEKYRGCPVLFTDDYSEITEEYLAAKYAEMVVQTYDFSRLFLSSYDVSTQNEIRRNGNYWSRRIIGRDWY